MSIDEIVGPQHSLVESVATLNGWISCDRISWCQGGMHYVCTLMSCIEFCGHSHTVEAQRNTVSIHSWKLPAKSRTFWGWSGIDLRKIDAISSHNYFCTPRSKDVLQLMQSCHKRKCWYHTK
jgi:hypothetical protein